jgi:thiamine biosynthesis lipoprotein
MLRKSAKSITLKGEADAEFLSAPARPSACGNHLLKNRALLKHFVLVLFLACASGVALRASEVLRLEANADAMGSTYSVILYGEDRNKLEAASEAAFDEARRIDLLLSNYKPESEWSQINREAADHPVRVSKELFELLTACNNYSRKSEGTFDITVGPLMKIWGFYKGSGHLPQPGDVKQAMGQIGYQNIVLDPSKQTVFFSKPGLSLDPGGVGKGYAVDRMVEILKKEGIQSALVSGGGSSIYCLGNPPDEPAGWRVEIKDPHDELKAAAEITLKNQSLSTSGSYEKFFMAEGKTFSHIMDPRTGYPAQGTLSVSVIAPLTLDSEIWAKPYFILGPQWVAAHKPRDFRVFYCADSSAAVESKQILKVNQPCAWLQ